MLFSLYTSMYRIFLFNAFPGGLLNLLAVLLRVFAAVFNAAKDEC